MNRALNSLFTCLSVVALSAVASGCSAPVQGEGESDAVEIQGQAQGEVQDEGDGEPQAPLAPPRSKTPAAAALPAFDVEPPALPPSTVVSKYGHLDPAGVVPSDLLTQALAFFDANQGKIKNQAYVTVVDFSKHSGKKRFFVINMASGVVEQHVTAHGSGSDSDNDGLAEKFSNASGSNASSIGYYLTAEVYDGKWGRSMRLDGLSPTNSAARSRAVVFHGADYVLETSAKQGRSWGCFVLPLNRQDAVIDKLRDGSLIFAGVSTVK
jgi:hypothetical protein